MKVAFLLPRYFGGGAEQVTLDLVRGLMKCDVDCRIWATRFGEGIQEELKECGIATRSLRDVIPGLHHNSSRTVDVIASLVRSDEIDILVLGVSPVSDPRRLRALLPESCRIVFHLHGRPFWETLQYGAGKELPVGLSGWFNFIRRDCKEILFHTYSRRAQRLYRSTYEVCDAYVTLTPAYKKELEERLGIKDRSNVMPIHNPFNASRFLNAAGHAKEREILFVGRLTYNDKRVDRLLRIWSGLAGKNTDWRLRIVGDGADMKHLKAMAADIERVSFEGFRAPVPFYGSASIVAMTSTFEGWPGVLTEALASGCRAIAFDSVAGIREILGDGRGTLVPSFDEEKYARALQRLMDEYTPEPEPVPEWLASLAPDKIVGRWVQLFQRIGNGRGA